MSNKFLESIINDKFVQQIIDKIKNEKDICPDIKNIFKAFELTNLDEVKVVIFGQDPYYLKGVANGLAFSTNSTITPKSLANIFQELRNEYPNIKIETNNLEYWAKQGVLLLNKNLSTKVNQPNAHTNIGWDYVIKKAIDYLNNKEITIIFLLWGNEAQKLIPLIDSKKHKILFTSHPSPLSASKGFFGSNHFLKTNEILRKMNLKEIDWNLKKE